MTRGNNMEMKEINEAKMLLNLQDKKYNIKNEIN